MRSPITRPRARRPSRSTRSSIGTKTSSSPTNTPASRPRRSLPPCGRNTARGLSTASTATRAGCSPLHARTRRRRSFCPPSASGGRKRSMRRSASIPLPARTRCSPRICERTRARRRCASSRSRRRARKRSSPNTPSARRKGSIPSSKCACTAARRIRSARTWRLSGIPWRGTKSMGTRRSTANTACGGSCSSPSGSPSMRAARSPICAAASLSPPFRPACPRREKIAATRPQTVDKRGGKGYIIRSVKQFPAHLARGNGEENAWRK